MTNLDIPLSSNISNQPCSRNTELVYCALSMPMIWTDPSTVQALWTLPRHGYHHSLDMPQQALLRHLGFRQALRRNLGLLTPFTKTVHSGRQCITLSCHGIMLLRLISALIRGSIPGHGLRKPNATGLIQKLQLKDKLCIVLHTVLTIPYSVI